MTRLFDNTDGERVWFLLKIQHSVTFVNVGCNRSYFRVVGQFRSTISLSVSRLCKEVKGLRRQRDRENCLNCGTEKA